MLNENLTSEIAEQAAATVSAALKVMFDQKNIDDMNACIVIIHPTAEIDEDMNLPVLYTASLGDPTTAALTENAAKMSARSIIHIRNMYRDSPKRRPPYASYIPTGAALKNGIVVGVYGLPKQFNQLIADWVASTCDVLCYEDDDPLPNVG